MGLTRFAVFLLLALACKPAAEQRGEVAADGIGPLAPPGLPASAFPAPSRPVADIISARWSDEDDRDRAGEADTVMALLGIGAGARVADVGAGSGYYTVRLSPRVGPAGQVYAQDITPRYLRDLRERVQREGLRNVTLVLGDPHDPRLPARSVDAVLMVHMYHEIEQPYALLHNLRPALAAGARVAVLDLDRPTNAHGTPPALLRCELGAAGYRETAFHPLSSGGYLAVFAAGDTVTPAAVRAAAGACGAAAGRG